MESADIRDLKSCASCERVGSNPISSTIPQLSMAKAIVRQQKRGNYMLFSRFCLQKQNYLTDNKIYVII